MMDDVEGRGEWVNLRRRGGQGVGAGRAAPGKSAGWLMGEEGGMDPDILNVQNCTQP